MEELLFIKGYKDNEQLRDSFNQLASSTFGIEFETWYQHGFWTEKYIPYSFIDKGNVVANVSVNLIDLVIHNEITLAVQIGTVMTHPDYRNTGLSRKLMEIVLEDYKHVDLIYLFANQTVLDFYPKFGFQAMGEVQFSMDYSYQPSNQLGIRKMDGSRAEDLAFIYSLARNRNSVSKMFGTTNSEELLLFYCLMVYSQDLYYLEDEKALVIFQNQSGILHLFDVVCREEIKIQDILRRIATPDIKKVVFHFHPDDFKVKLDTQTYQTSNVLFVKNLSNVSLPNEFKHPHTSQA